MLREAEQWGVPGEVCRRHRITRETLYRWRRKYGGLEVSDARRLRQLEDMESSSPPPLSTPLGIEAVTVRRTGCRRRSGRLRGG